VSAWRESQSYVFTIKVTCAVEVAARVDYVFDAFVGGIASWWIADGCPIPGGSASMHFDSTVGGQLRELWEPRGGKLWAFVTALVDAELLRLGIPHGVSWSGPGAVEIGFEPTGPDDTATTVTVTHSSAALTESDDQDLYLEGWRRQLETGFLRYFEALQRSAP
jgi:uncharacterized protein YndB with AHSA1/START domain